MKPSTKALIVLILCIAIESVINNVVDNNTQETAAKTYTQLLRLRRRDHKTLVQAMLKADYTKNYKMIKLALERIFQVIQQSNETLTKYNWTVGDGFPAEEEKQEAVTLILENTCLASDIILHFPEISYKVLAKIASWRDTMNWCIGFVNGYPQITNEEVVELLDLARQEINEDARSPDFVNPYYQKVNTDETTPPKKTKSKKKIRKGPQLTTKTEL